MHFFRKEIIIIIKRKVSLKRMKINCTSNCKSLEAATMAPITINPIADCTPSIIYLFYFIKLRTFLVEN